MTSSSKKKRFTNRRSPDPSPAAIRQACDEIQQSWSQREELKRRGILEPDASPSLCWAAPEIVVPNNPSRHSSESEE